MENLDPPPPPPQIKDGEMARFCPSRGLIPDLGGGGGWGFAVPFYFVQDCSFKRRFSFGKIPWSEWVKIFTKIHVLNSLLLRNLKTDCLC